MLRKIILLVFLMGSLFVTAGCQKIVSHFKTVNVRCLSYNGDLEIQAYKIGKNTAPHIGSLIFIGNNANYRIANTDDVEYVGSGMYRNAELVRSNSKGLYLILMPDQLHGIAGMWKDNEGNYIDAIQVPVLCFKANSSFVPYSSDS